MLVVLYSFALVDVVLLHRLIAKLAVWLCICVVLSYFLFKEDCSVKNDRKCADKVVCSLMNIQCLEGRVVLLKPHPNSIFDGEAVVPRALC
jgi:hypothetical protein